MYACVFDGMGWDGTGRGLGVAVCRFSVGVLSTLPSAKSLPMPLWFYLLYDFLVNFILFLKCAILISLTMPIKGNVFEKNQAVFLSVMSPFIPAMNLSSSGADWRYLFHLKQHYVVFQSLNVAFSIIFMIH